MAKIGDLFVWLGLKSDGFKKGMRDAQNETSSFSKGLSKMKAGAVAVWAAIGTAAIKFATDFVNATNKVGDAWANTMSGIKAGWHTLLAELSNTSIDTSGSGSKLGNWWKNEIAWYKRVFGNVKEAGKVAAEASAEFDNEFELANSVRLQRSQIAEELNQLYAVIRDTTLNAYTREDATKRYKGLLAPIVNAEVDAYEKMLNSAVEKWQAGTNLSRAYSTDELVEFFSNYGTNKAGMTAKYGELANVYENLKGDKQNKEVVDYALKLQDARNQISALDKEMARAAVSIKKSRETMFKIGSDSPKIWARKTAKELKQEVADTLRSQDASLDDFDPFGKIDMQSAYDDLGAWNKALMDAADKSKQIMQGIENSMVSSLANGMQAFTDMMFGLEGADAKGILAALMQPFADTAGQLGAMLVAQGLAIETFKTSLGTLQGAPAIAAGAALLAISAAMKSGIKSLAGGGAGTGTSASYGGSSYGNTGDVNYDSTLTIYVEGKVSGGDILLAGKRTQDKWSR